MIPLLVVLVLLLTGALVFLIISSTSRQSSPRVSEAEVDWSGVQGKKVHSHCPLCGEPLTSKERVHSDLFPGGPDPKAPRMMHIHGCPYCYRKHPSVRLPLKNSRRCPSCGQNMPDGGFCYAHFYQNSRKTHVSVLGCTLCR